MNIIVRKQLTIAQKKKLYKLFSATVNFQVNNNIGIVWKLLNCSHHIMTITDKYYLV